MASKRPRRPQTPPRDQKPTAVRTSSSGRAAPQARPATNPRRGEASRARTGATSGQVSAPRGRARATSRPSPSPARPRRDAGDVALARDPGRTRTTPPTTNGAQAAPRKPSASRARPATLKDSVTRPPCGKSATPEPAAPKAAGARPAARAKAKAKASARVRTEVHAPARPAISKQSTARPPVARGSTAGKTVVRPVAARRAVANGGAASGGAARNAAVAPRAAPAAAARAELARERLAARPGTAGGAAGLRAARAAARAAVSSPRPGSALTRRTRTGVVVRLAVSHRTMKPAPLAKAGTGPALARTSPPPAPPPPARAPLPAGVVRGRPGLAPPPHGTPRPLTAPAESGDPEPSSGEARGPVPAASGLDENLDEAARTAGLPELDRAGKRLAHALLERRSVLALAPDSARLPAAVEIAGLVAQGPVVIVSARAESLRARCERLQLRRLPAVHLAAGTAGGDGEVLARIAAGGPLLVFASPAALQDPAVRASLRASRLAALAIEEAHALSEWSHELSPAAGSLPQAVGELEPAALVAHVPVAIPVVARDVTERLLLRHALRIELPLLRPNVTLECVAARGDARHRALLALVSRLRRPGLVLCRTAADVDAVHSALAAIRVPVHRHHAGLAAAERSAELLAFSMPGRRAVLVATSGFSPLASPPLASPPAGRDAEPGAGVELGPGFEKRDVRFVIHHEAPSTLEQLAREIDLAGRDGEPATAVLLYDPGDLRRWEQSLAEARPRPSELVRLASELTALARGEQGTTLDSLALTTGTTLRQAGALTRLLASAGGVGFANGWVQPLLPRAALLDRARRLADTLETFFLQDPERRRAVHLLGEARGCRTAVLTRYFGGSGEARCGRCSVCTGSTAALWGSEADAAPRRRPDARDFAVAPGALAGADDPPPRAEPPATREEGAGG